jgi:hypothetical protein
MFGMGKSKLKKAIEYGIAEGNLDDKIDELGDVSVKSVDDAEAVCWGLEQLGKEAPTELSKSVHALARLLEDADNDNLDVIELLRERGLPQLFRLYDRIALVDDFAATDCLMSLLRIYALFNTEFGTAKIIEAARKPLNPDGYMWSLVLGLFSDGHSHRKQLFEALANPLPHGFIAVALLDSANKAAIADEDFVHPFDSPEGADRLRSWLRDVDPESYSYAHSAAAALPFISEPVRSELSQLAMDHPDAGVSIEAAWSAAKLGQQRGIAQLARYACDVKTSIMACHYLTELKREDAIPAEAQDPEFQARAEMVSWLAHPNEFGEPPDAIEKYDSRELYWPPTNDRRRVWLFKYRYAPNERRKKEDVGLGMVGSKTFALFSENSADLSPIDAYALHCCWELEVNKDPRAPKKQSVAEGRKLLAEHNSL